MADLVDLMTFWLGSEYAQWTTDPDDPDVKRRKRTKPPPFPLIRPVAHRPPSVAQQYDQRYVEQVVQFGQGEVVEEPTARRMVSTLEFDAALDKAYPN